MHDGIHGWWGGEEMEIRISNPISHAVLGNLTHSDPPSRYSYQTLLELVLRVYYSKSFFESRCL